MPTQSVTSLMKENGYTTTQCKFVVRKIEDLLDYNKGSFTYQDMKLSYDDFYHQQGVLFVEGKSYAHLQDYFALHRNGAVEPDEPAIIKELTRKAPLDWPGSTKKGPNSPFRS